MQIVHVCGLQGLIILCVGICLLGEGGWRWTSGCGLLVRVLVPEGHSLHGGGGGAREAEEGEEED